MSEIEYSVTPIPAPTVSGLVHDLIILVSSCGRIEYWHWVMVGRNHRQGREILSYPIWWKKENSQICIYYIGWMASTYTNQNTFVLLFKLFSWLCCGPAMNSFYQRQVTIQMWLSCPASSDRQITARIKQGFLSSLDNTMHSYSFVPVKA